MHSKISSAKWRPFCLGLNMLTLPNNMDISSDFWRRCFASSIDPSRISYNAFDKYSTMPRFVTEMFPDVHISVTTWCIVVCRTGELWDFCNVSNTPKTKWNPFAAIISDAKVLLHVASLTKLTADVRIWPLSQGVRWWSHIRLKSHREVLN